MATAHAAFWENATADQREARAVWRGKRRPDHAAKLKGRPRADRRSLTFAQAEEIRALKADGATYSDLAVRFGLDRCSLHRIITKKTYAKDT